MVAEQISIGDEELEQTLEARNAGDEPFELTAALHTYIAVSSIEKVKPEQSNTAMPSTAGSFRTGAVQKARCRDNADMQPHSVLLSSLRYHTHLSGSLSCQHELSEICRCLNGAWTRSEACMCRRMWSG